MNNAIGSRVMLSDLSNLIAFEYNECVGDLLEIEDVQRLGEYSQHMNVSRLQHSINVSYYSYLIAKLLGADHRSAARAGILHDLYLYDWREEKQEEGAHAFAHPKIALKNAKKNVSDLNEIEEDAIVNHMFPLTITFPKYKESYIVCMADKYCATIEVLAQLKTKFFGKKKDKKSDIEE